MLRLKYVEFSSKDKKKRRWCIAFLNYSFNFIEEEMQYDVKKKKKQAKFLLPASLFFRGKKEQPILTETCLIKKFCGKICQCSRSPDSAETCRNLRRSILIM